MGARHQTPNDVQIIGELQTIDEARCGIRNLDTAHVQAGPTSSQLMGFLGADVIKLESPQ